MIHSSASALSVLGGSQAHVHDVVYSNLNIEFSSDQQPEVLQLSERQVYEQNDNKALPCLIKISNMQYFLRKKSSRAVERSVPNKLGTLKDIRFENICVFTDSDDIRPIIYAHCEGDAENISNIKICRLYLNNIKQNDFSGFDLQVENFDGSKLLND